MLKILPIMTAQKAYFSQNKIKIMLKYIFVFSDYCIIVSDCSIRVSQIFIL